MPTRAEVQPASRTRLSALAQHDLGAAALATKVVGLAQETVGRSVLGDGRTCFTLRRPRSGGAAVAEGVSSRYASIVSLGVGLLSAAEQRRVLGGCTARDLYLAAIADLGPRPELGDLAMAAWAVLEAGGPEGTALVDRLLPTLVANPLPHTVASAWTLTALTAAGRTAQATDVARALVAAAGPSGLFPHWLRPGQAPRLRRHVGCFADQVYPIQALARHAHQSGDEVALAAAQRCADTICTLQGRDGQWWWHYDVRAGTVVEGYPVYAVHQAGMAPMALLDLQDAGGRADLDAIARGLHWLGTPTEAAAALVDEQERLVWRKVGRREPVRRAVRAVRSATTAVSPHWRLGLLDRAFPPGPVDHESRPYEAGWALYAWLRSS